MNKIAIIVGGGLGLRMKSNIPKQFIEVNGKPIILHTIYAFIKAYEDMHFILVVPKDFVEITEKMIHQEKLTQTFTIVEGGATRFQSVKNGLGALNHEFNDGIIFIHDAVRCLVSAKLIKQGFEESLKFGNAIPALVPNSSVRFGNFEGNSTRIDRNKIFLIQTPQCFKLEQLNVAYNQIEDESFTDDATVVEKAGFLLRLILGEEENIKITTPFDLKLLKVYLFQNSNK